MSDINTLKTQIQSLIDGANATTGNSDKNLTDGVNSLIEGYGKGEMSSILFVNDFEVKTVTHPTIEMSGTTNTIGSDATNIIIGVTTYEEVL